MKLLIVLIVLISVVSSTFINFLPFRNKECQGTSSGVGYSITSDACITFDNIRNYQFSYDSDLNTVKWAPFNNGTDVLLDCSESIGESMTATNGECIDSLGEYPIDYNFSPKDKGYYYKVSISDTPAYLEYSYVNSYSYGTGCLKNIVFASFSSNYTAIRSNNDEIAYCLYNSAYTRTCQLYQSLPYCSDNFIYYVCNKNNEFYKPISNDDVNTKSLGYYSTTTCMGTI